MVEIYQASGISGRRSSKGKQLGRIYTRKGKFGFALSESGERLYFSSNYLIDGKHWPYIKIGTKAFFMLAENNLRKCAVDIKPLIGTIAQQDFGSNPSRACGAPNSARKCRGGLTSLLQNRGILAYLAV